MKTLLTLLFLCITSLMSAQEYAKLYGNNRENVAVIFSEPIRQAIVGNDNFAFGYSQENPHRLGLLKAQPGRDSNLLVITTDNRLYTFHLKYADSLHTWNYFIQASSGKRLKKADSLKLKDKNPGGDNAKFEKMAGQLLQSPYRTLQYNRSDGIRLAVNKVLFYSDYLILIMELENQSRIIFEPGKFRVFAELGNQKKKASYQKISLVPWYTSEIDPSILTDQRERFAVILPKYIPGKNHRLSVEIQERTTSRAIRLKIRKSLFK